MNKKILIAMGMCAVISGGIFATTVLASTSNDESGIAPVQCNINHIHEDYYCISGEIQDYWSSKQVNEYNAVMKERDEYINYMKNKGYKDERLLDAIQGYDSSLRHTEEVFMREVFEAKDSEVKSEENN